MIVALLLLLLLHLMLAVPLLVRKKKPWAFAAVALGLLGAYAAYVMLLSGVHGGPPPDGPGGPGGPGPIRPEVLMILLGFLLQAAGTGIVYLVRAPRSAARIRELETEIREKDTAAQKTDAPEYIQFRAEGKTVRVETDSIRYAEGMSEYIKIWRDGAAEPLVILERIKNLQEMLPPARFMRVHRSYIINLARIREAGRDGITLDDGTTIPVGDSYRQVFREYLSGT